MDPAPRSPAERMRPAYLTDGALDHPTTAAPAAGDPDVRLGDEAERTAKRDAVTAAALERIRARAGPRRRNVFGVVVE